MFQQLTLVQMTIFMALGAVFSLVGLYFLFRPPQTDGETKLQMFGITVNASSVGLVVFLVGAAFVATPAFVPVRDSAMLPFTNGPSGESGEDLKGDASDTPTPGKVPQRRAADGDEGEPNDTWDDANVIAPDGSMKGTVTEASEDWFYVPLTEGQQNVEIQLRHQDDGTLSCYAHFYRPNETYARVGGSVDFPYPGTKRAWTLFTDGDDGLFIRLESRVGNCSYELFVNTS